MMNRAAQSRSIVVVAIAMSVATMALGASLPAPKKMIGGLALIWGLVAVSKATLSSAHWRRIYAFVGPVLTTTGAAMLLFTADWATSGRQQAVLYVSLRDATSRPIDGATVVLKGVSGSPQQGVADAEGIWMTRVTVPERTDYRLIGSTTEFDLRGISLIVNVNGSEASWELARMDGVTVAGPARNGGPALIYASLTDSTR